jgi:Uri superfamily endonuclease
VPSESESAAGVSDAPPDPVVLTPEAVAAGTDPLGVGAGDALPGTYVLVFRVDDPATIPVGALGSVSFWSGAYAYVGSAFGASGLGRVDRHRRVADGSHDVRHWHVDYLGGHPDVSLVAVVAAPHAEIECELAAALRGRLASHDVDEGGEGDPVAMSGFGASDCGCPAHLVGGVDATTLRTAAVEAIRAVVSAGE